MMTMVDSSGVVGEKNKSVKVCVEGGRIIKRKKKTKVRADSKRSNNNRRGNLQKLFDACKFVFTGHGAVPSPEDVRILSNILDAMKPEDVGLSRDLQFSRRKKDAQGTPRVASAMIYKCKNFELSIFFLPTNAVIPLHNHPEMTVFSKLLLGTMHIKAYDWVDGDHFIASPSYPSSSSSSPRLAKLKANRNFTAPCDSSVLYPTSGGNIHEFRAITPCVVLDVIGPPYSKEDGRDGSYYREVVQEGLLKFKDGEDDDCYGWLEEIQVPKESEMDQIEYMGPQIVDSTSSR